MKNKNAASCEFVLDGKVFLVEKDADGKELSKEEIDGMLILKTVVAAIEHGQVFEAENSKTCCCGGHCSCAEPA